MRVRKALLQTTMLAGIVGATFLSIRDAKAAEPVFAPNYAAVDGINGKIEGLGGSLAHKGLYGARGSLSIPLGGLYGLQYDGELGSWDSKFYGKIGAHLFWRDPSRGLIGLYAGHTHWSKYGGVHVTQVAAEGEYYWDRLTLHGVAGVEFGNTATSTASSIVPHVPGTAAPGITTTMIDGYDVKTRFFDQIDLKYYWTDNSDTYIGHRYLGGKHALALGGEAALPVGVGGGRMLTAFVEGRIGEDDFQGVWGGLKAYFGQRDKTLIRRHREDDPGPVDSKPSISNSHFTSIGTTLTCGADGFRTPTTCEIPVAED